MLTFKGLDSGLYVYHCATPMVAHHVTNGMYGLILVEPEGGLAPVDREFYVMQGELYTQQPFGQHGPQECSLERLLAERADYPVFNGAVSTSRGSRGAAADGCTDNTDAGRALGTRLCPVAVRVRMRRGAQLCRRDCAGTIRLARSTDHLTTG